MKYVVTRKADGAFLSEVCQDSNGYYGVWFCQFDRATLFDTEKQASNALVSVCPPNNTNCISWFTVKHVLMTWKIVIPDELKFISKAEAIKAKDSIQIEEII